MADGGWFFLFIVTFFLGPSSSSYDELLQERDEIIRHVILEPSHVITRRSIDQPLRISLDFLDLSLLEDQSAVTAVVRKARDYFSKTLKVRKTVSKILLQRRCPDDRYFLRDESGLNLGNVRFCQGTCSSSKKLCGPVDIPEHDLDRCRTCDRRGQNCKGDSTAGVGHKDTDFVLYVTAITKDCNKDKTIAYGAACQQEGALDRPVAGFINICPEKVTKRELETSYDGVLATIKHEIFHALAFAPPLYAFFRNQTGSPLTARGANGLPTHFNSDYYLWSEETVKEVIRSDWLTSSGLVPHKVHLMVTPTVREEVRRHFNCSALEGAELENQGSKGTFLGHWEKRLFENEAMTGVFTQNPVFSRITLALMEDTGWYRVDYTMAEPLQWGRNLGCTFAMKSCKAWMERSAVKEENRLEPFCNIPEKSSVGLKTGCSFDRTSVAKCNLVKYDNLLPREYRYFDSIPGVTGSEGLYGGTVDLADYCPYFLAFTWTQKGTEVHSSSCSAQQNTQNQSKNIALETRGRSSLCFEQQRKWTTWNCKVRWTASHWGSGCYEYLCDRDVFKIKIKGYEFKCFHKGQRISIAIEDEDWKYSGVLICPSCDEVCYNSNITCPAEIQPVPQSALHVPSFSTVCSQGTHSCVSDVRYMVLVLCVYVVILLTGI